MQSHIVLHDVFRVVAAGPWDAESFGIVQIELEATKSDAFFPPRLIVRLRETGKPPLTFDAEGYHYEGGILRLWTGGKGFRWVFRAVV